jgi:hypothetical protein
MPQRPVPAHDRNLETSADIAGDGEVGVCLPQPGPGPANRHYCYISIGIQTLVDHLALEWLAGAEGSHQGQGLYITVLARHPSKT